MKRFTFIGAFLVSLMLVLNWPQPSFAFQVSQSEIMEIHKREGLMDYGDLARIAARIGEGRVVGQALFRQGDFYYYRMKVLRRNGIVVLVYLNAKTGRVIRDRGG